LKILFACCARNCRETLPKNVASLCKLAESISVDDFKIYIAENDSVDGTREVILNLAAQDPRVVPVLLESLDNIFATREQRIAFCRDQLLNVLLAGNSDGLYCPADLDLDLATPGVFDSFFSICELVSSGYCTAIFPSSMPFYYDIHALRAYNWCLQSCWKQIEESRARGSFWRLLVSIRFVFSRQKHYSSLQSGELRFIPVLSAFGGIGVYSLAKIVDSGARYSSPALGQHDSYLCEHVVFNSFLDHLFIDTHWLVCAPHEHIKFRLLAPYQQIHRIAEAALSDIKWILRRIW
jgi:hypothetical protein